MSQHSVDVVRIQKEPHPNADSLSIVRVRGFTVVVRSDDWQDGELAAYVEPDYVVPSDRPEFAFMSAFSKEITNSGVTGYRVRVKKLRGVPSMGLLVKAPEGAAEGDDIMSQLGIARYEPPIPLAMGGEALAGPAGYRPKYDVESLRRYPGVLQENELVIATEKIHGANARYTFIEGEGMYCGSRTEWKRQDANNLWWRALAATPGLQRYCEAYPGFTVYGEVYGQVQDLKYGIQEGARFIAFDILDPAGHWWNFQHMASRLGQYDVPVVPRVYLGPWSDEVVSMADGKSLLAAEHGDPDQIREGIVIRPYADERHDARVGRVQLKVVSNDYLERA